MQLQDLAKPSAVRKCNFRTLTVLRSGSDLENHPGKPSGKHGEAHAASPLPEILVYWSVPGCGLHWFTILVAAFLFPGHDFSTTKTADFGYVFSLFWSFPWCLVGFQLVRGDSWAAAVSFALHFGLLPLVFPFSNMNAVSLSLCVTMEVS